MISNLILRYCKLYVNVEICCLTELETGESVIWSQNTPECTKSHTKFQKFSGGGMGRGREGDILHHLQHGKVILQKTDCMKMFAKNASW